EYREVVPNERLVTTEVYEGMPEGEAVVTHTFSEKDGRTALTILMQLPSQSDRDAVINSGMKVGCRKRWTTSSRSLSHCTEQAHAVRSRCGAAVWHLGSLSGSGGRPCPNRLLDLNTG